MITRLDVDGSTLYQSAVGMETAIESPPGWLLGSPSPRGYSITRPERHGSLNLTRNYDARTGPLEGWIRSVDFPAFYQAITRLQTLLGLRDDDHVLTYWLQDGSSRFVRGRVASDLAIDPGEWKSPAATWSVSIECGDPRSYGTALQSVAFDPFGSGVGGLKLNPNLLLPLKLAPSSTYQASISNAGSAESPPSIDILGPWVNPWIENITTGVKMYTQNLSLGAGEHLIIDTAAESVLLNGLSAIGKIDWGRSDWPVVVPGQNLYRGGGAASSGALMTISAYSAWI